MANSAGLEFDIPEAFCAGVLQERGEAGRTWLDNLPQLVARYCAQWHLTLAGEAMHGYIALVLPVRRGDEACILKVSWVDDETRHEGLVLDLWQGNGAVRVLAADNEAGVLLLEKLNARISLASIEINKATTVAAQLLRRLAIEAPPVLAHTNDFARRQAAALRQRWLQAGQPFSEFLLEQTEEIAVELSQSRDNFLVNQDLHFENVLRGIREQWLVIDPKPVSGDIEFGAAPLLWNRTGEGDISTRMTIIAEAAGLKPALVKKWSLLRVVDYWLWSLAAGFTDDPVACRDLAEAINSYRA